MSLDRFSVIKGPAVVTFHGQTIISQGDITVRSTINTFPINTSPQGQVDVRVNDVVTEVSFTPDGEWSAGFAETFFPFQPDMIGKSIFNNVYVGQGNTDLPLLIKPTVGAGGLGFKAAAISRSPTLRLSAGAVPIGPITFTCIGQHDDITQRTTPSGPGTASGMDPTKIFTVPYSVNGAGFTDLETVDGITIDIGITTTPLQVDSDGTIDIMLSGVTATARFRPVGLTDEEIWDILGIDGLSRGVSFAQTGVDFIIASRDGVTGSPGATLFGARVRSAQAMYGQTQHRGGEIEVVATQQSVAGVLQDLYEVHAET